MKKQILRSISNHGVRIIIAIALAIIGVGMLIVSVPLFSIMAFGVAIWLVYSVIDSGIHDWNEVKSQERRAKLENERREKAQSIGSSGGPKSLEDYLFLFPDACPKCGSRNLSQWNWIEGSTHYADPHDIYEVGLATSSHSRVICKRCKQVLSTSSSTGGDLIQDDAEEQTLRVSSPYLSKELSDSIPDFPYQSSH
jgi:hypothetical protein